MPVDAPTLFGALLLAACWGVLHGLTPHGHSWLVMLPFMLGGAKTGVIVRMALAFGLGMTLAAAGAGALLGVVSSRIPENWHNTVEIALGVLLALAGLAFLIRPLSAHHAVDHLCGEGCQSGEQKALLRTGTFGAMFLFGMASVVLPCPTNIPVYAVPLVRSTPAIGALIFAVYALATSLVILLVGVATVRARTFLEALNSRGTRAIIWRISGVIVLAMGLYLIVLGARPHDHGAHDHDHETPAQHEMHDHDH